MLNKTLAEALCGGIVNQTSSSSTVPPRMVVEFSEVDQRVVDICVDPNGSESEAAATSETCRRLRG